MKRTISVLLLFCILCGVFSVYISADVASEVSEYITSDVGTVNLCVYDSESGKVNVSGNIDHDFLIKHSKHYIALYAVPFGWEYREYLSSEDAIQLAKTDMSVKFEFSVKAETYDARFSGYCVVILDDNGEMIPISEPKYPSVPSDFEFKEGDKRAFKGVSTSLTSLAVASNASASIVPVYLNRLLSSASVGHLYSMQGSYIYFDKAYIDELDVRIRSISATSGAVYLRFLLDTTESSSISALGDSGIPDMSSGQNLDLIAAFTDFLCDRYDHRYFGTVKGIILGGKIDTAFSVSLCDSISQYADNYIRYAAAVAGVSRVISEGIDIVFPFGNVDAYSDEVFDGGCSPVELTELICEKLDSGFVSPFAFSTMIETDVLPLGLSDESLDTGNTRAVSDGPITADNVWRYSSYVKSLRAKYDNAPHSYIFVWDINEKLSYNLLSTAYAYSYYKLLGDDMLSSFVVSFEALESKGYKDGFPMISELIEKIDTSESFKISAPQLKLLRAESWYEVVDDMYGGNLNMKRTLNFNTLEELPSDILGSYSYFDYAYQTDTSSWFGGSDCDKINLDYNASAGRTLKAHFKNELAMAGEFGELYCAYEYNENFVFTPYMVLNFSIENDSSDKNSLYEVRVTFGSNNNISKTSIVCAPYECVELCLDMSEFNGVSMAEYIVISTRSLSGTEGGYSLCFASMKGYSSLYRSEELSTLIPEERLRIRNLLEDNDTEGEKGISKVLIAAGVAVVVAVIAIGVFMCFRHDEEYDE